MPRFRYEAIDQQGVPIHGTADAVDAVDLHQQLAARGMKLVSSSELSLDALIGNNQHALPRLFQLRVGEQLREALLTGLPAHEAVRAVAAEPLSHPMLGIIPWVQVIALLTFAAAAARWSITGISPLHVVTTGIFAVVVVPIIWLVLLRFYQSAPRHLLRTLANRLEAGEPIPSSINLAMPRELRCVISSDVEDSLKARVAADLVPNLLGTNLRVQQFILAVIGPMIMLGVVAVGLYSMLLFVVPHFKKMFDDFGIDLPWLTTAIVGLADIVMSLGLAGWITFVVLITSGTVFTAVCLATGRGSEFLEKIPVAGIAFRWAMQARVARILSAMLRNDCSYSQSIRTATAGSGFEAVRTDGETLAKELETRSGQMLPARKLSGLPISMLFVTNASVNETERRAAMAGTFQSLSEMLDSATLGQGRLFSVLLQFFTILATGLAIGIGVVAMFLPLIHLLNNLA